MNHAPSGTMAETAAPGTVKNDNTMTSDAARGLICATDWSWHLHNPLPPDYAVIS